MFSKKNNKVIPLGLPPLSPTNEMIGSSITTPTSPGMPLKENANHLHESPGINIVTDNLLGLFHNIPGVAIHQDKSQDFDAIKSIRTSLVYFYNNNEELEKQPRFKCKMRNVSCWKLFCSHCQGLDIEILLMRENQPDLPFLRVVRPCTFSLCGYNRPRTEIFITENGKSELLGYFLEPSYCFDIVFSVYSKTSRQAEFIVDGNCFQRNLWCPGGVSNIATFSIATHRFEVLSKFIKTLKKGNDKYTADTANAHMAFPLDANETEIALLMCVAILLDYKYFDS